MNDVARLALTEIKIYKITPCASATAIGGTIDYISIKFSASKGIGGVTGGNFIFYRQIDIPLYEITVIP